MQFFKILVKEIKHTVRSKRSFFMNLLFPIILIAILGTALSGTFSNSSSSSDSSIGVIYTNNGGKAYDELLNSLKNVKNIGVSFSEAESKEESLNKVKNRNYSCYIDFEKENITIYSNNKETMDTAKVEAIISSALQQYKLKTILLSGSSVNADNQIKNKNYVNEVSLNGPKSPRALDYYSVTMITMIIAYACMGGLEIFNMERSRKTGTRMLYAPVRKLDIFAGKMIGNLFVKFIQYLILILFTKFIFKSYWGDHLGIIILIVLTQTIMCLALGTMISCIVKNYAAGRQILNVAIGVISFLGGAYFPIDNVGKVIGTISEVSPLKWTNEAIFQIIYRNDFSYITRALLISIGLSIIFIAISARYMKKEAFLNE